MKMRLAILWALSMALFANVQGDEIDEGHYMILVPRNFVHGKPNNISVTMYKTTEEESITFEVFRLNETYLTVETTVSPDSSKFVELTLPPELKEHYSVKIRATGRGAIEFNSTTSIWISKGDDIYTLNTQAIRAQLDRPFYSSSQWVRMRTFGLNMNLTTVQQPMNISVFDPNGNMLAKWTNEHSPSGVVSKSFQLSDKPTTGTWHFKICQGKDEAFVYFKVRSYSLPKFEVNVDAAHHIVDFSMGYLYLLHETFDVNVTAHYTFGKPVTGKLELNVSLGHRQEYTIHKVMNISGSVSVNIPFRELLESNDTIHVPQYRSYCNIPNIVIKAKVTEALTQKSMMSPEATIKVESAPIRVSHSSSRNLKYGLPNFSDVTIERIDGKPLTENDRMHPLKIKFSDNDPKEFQIPVDGKVRVLIDVPEKQNMNLRMEILYTGFYKGRAFELKSSPYLSRFRAVNNTNIEAIVHQKYYKVGEEVHIEVNSSRPISSASYLLMKDRKTLMNRFVEVNDETHFTVKFTATEDMIPNVDFLITAISTEGSFAADGGKIPITVTLENKITANFSAPEGRAGDDVTLDVHTSPHSTVFMMAIDRSIELLEKPDYITEEDILSVIGGMPGSVTKVNAYNPKEIIRNFGLDIMTNFPGIETLTRYPFEVSSLIPLEERRQFQAPVMSSMYLKDNGPGGKSSGSKQTIRSFFPETWIWTEGEADESGNVHIAAKVPDTITRWVANGFSVGPNGVAPMKKPTEFYSYQPFFLFMDYPKSVIRDESFPLKVSVFNYLKTDQEVNVTLLPSDELNPEEMHFSKLVHIKSNEQELVTFDISLKQVGSHPLKVRAASSEMTDEVHKYVLVKPEGVTKYFNKPIMMNVTGSEPLVENFVLTFNDTASNIVPDSVRIEVSVIGDLMSQIDATASGLVRKPSGCGEQNMINFYPNVLTHKYLKETNRLGDDLKKQLVEYTRHGYQNQLKYQHKTGSFSAFGERDSRGSTWLTAFVLRCFSEAKKSMPEVYIDDNVLIKAVRWLFVRQSENGKFFEVGQVLHKAMQGGASEGTAMTAYILLSLLEYKDLIDTHEHLEPTRNSTDEAIALAEMYLRSVPGNMYSKAIFMYANALLGNDESFEELRTELENNAIIEGDFKYWKSMKVKRSWYAEDEYVEEPDVEMSAYVLLAYAKRNEVEKGLPILRWLVKMRSSLGGYDSTQSTVIALQALSQFAPLISSCCDQSVTINVVDNTGYSYSFPTINSETNTILYKHVMPPDTTSITFKGEGKGFVLVQTSWQYNILKEEESKSNIVSSVQANCTSSQRFNLQICSTWLANETSGMGLIEIQLPSGYVVDTGKYLSLPFVKRIELEDSIVNIYLDEVPREKYCLTVEAEKWYEINNRKVAQAVTTSLFYDSSESTVKTYEIDCSAQSSN
ncbi:CD109 antigen isoform X1 [Octopus sinensis]|uniref:CD109 antigen isoform X1 n=1 Tax=Octopus sinensis TaxID=2607531 RepID=A0A7E6F3R1_9MOLL|nr:CD109 antigen isoform X1 [Octopus sinensis]XP_036362359.1 CD109 antigen isoform X1 [Octopus sinensis]